MRLLMDLTPERFYLIVEFFVAELQKFLLAKRLLAATKATYFCPQGGHCGEVQLYLKIPWKSEIIIVHFYVALLNLQFLIFFFR